MIHVILVALQPISTLFFIIVVQDHIISCGFSASNDFIFYYVIINKVIVCVFIANKNLFVITVINNVILCDGLTRFNFILIVVNISHIFYVAI